VPQVRTSVPGPKMFFSNAFTRSVQRALVEASPRLFRPRYAGANLGHPSHFLGRGWGAKQLWLLPQTDVSELEDGGSVKTNLPSSSDWVLSH
jgi:hypothetical protein